MVGYRIVGRVVAPFSFGKEGNMCTKLVCIGLIVRPVLERQKSYFLKPGAFPLPLQNKQIEVLAKVYEVVRDE